MIIQEEKYESGKSKLRLSTYKKKLPDSSMPLEERLKTRQVPEFAKRYIDELHQKVEGLEQQIQEGTIPPTHEPGETTYGNTVQNRETPIPPHHRIFFRLKGGSVISARNDTDAVEIVSLTGRRIILIPQASNMIYIKEE